MRLKEGSIKRCAIFLYYDKQGMVDDYVIYLLNDLNKNIVYIMDPMEGNVTRNLETFQSRYEAMHSQAVYIIE